MLQNWIHKLFKNKKYLMMIIVLVALLTITIGSALISSSLSVVGNTTFKKNSWIIYFDNIHVPVDSVSTDKPADIVDMAKTRVEFRAELKRPGDLYEFTVDTVNDGTIDAYIESIRKYELTDEQKEYLEFYVEYADIDINEANANPELKVIKPCDALYSGTRRKIIAYVKYKEGLDLEKYPTQDIRLDLFFEIKYVQSTICNPVDINTECKLIINPNEGTYEGRREPRHVYLDVGSTYTISEPARPYYNFTEWTRSKDEEQGTYSIEENVFTMKECDVITITAEWEEGDYVARIMDTYYPTIQEAFDAVDDRNWLDNTVHLLKNVEQDAINLQDADNHPTNAFVFDLEGFTVTGQITNSMQGNITLVNGRIEAKEEQNVAFINYGTLTMGIDDGIVEVDNSIALVGNNAGLHNLASSEFNFYDGYIEGLSGIIGKYNYTRVAPNHFVFSDYIAVNKHQKLYLVRNPNRAVVRTTTGGTIYYFDIPGAVQKAEGSKRGDSELGDSDYVIEVLRDFEGAYDVSISSDSRIFIETNGFDVEIGKEFVNNGYLNIDNNKSEMNYLKPSKTIINNGTLDINNIDVLVTANTTAIKNTGSLNLTKSKVEGNSSYGVSNEGSGTLSIDADTVLTGNGSYGLNNTSSNLVLSQGTIYGLNNTGTVTLKDNIELKNGTSSTYSVQNGGTITQENGSCESIKNTGTYTLNDGTIRYVENNSTFIQNEGTVSEVLNHSSYTQKGGLVTGSGSPIIRNNGTYTLEDGEIICTDTCVGPYSNYGGTFNIKGGLVESENGTAVSLSSVNVSGGEVHTSNGTAIGANSMTITAGYVHSDNGAGVSTSTANVNGGLIEGTSLGVTGSYVNIRDGKINAIGTGVSCSTSLSMTGGEVKTENGVGIIVSSNGTITGGKVEAGLYGVENKGILTIGSNDGEISSTVPEIIGGSYGLYIEGSQTNFYDGILKGEVDGYKEDTGRITGTPLGATIGENVETIDGVEYQTDFIVEYENWLKIGDVEYNSIDAASDACPENETCTIKVFKNPEITFVQTFKDANNNKNIIFDLDGHTIHATQTINNRSTVTIVDTSDEKTGTFEVGRIELLANYNTLTIEDGLYKSTNGLSVVSNRSGTVTVEGGTFRGSTTGFENRGTLIINDGLFEGTYGIKNCVQDGSYCPSGSITVNGGTIKGSSTGIIYGSTTVNDGEILSDGDGIYGSVTVNGGLVHAKNGYALTNGSITVNGGEVISDNSYGTWTSSRIVVTGGKVTGTIGVTHTYWCDTARCYYEPITVTGGEITGTEEMGLYGKGNTITVTGGLIKGKTDGLYLIYDTRTVTVTYGVIGTDEGNISISVPELRGERYGLYTEVYTSYSDGILEGKEKAHEGLISIIPNATMIYDDYKYINREEYKTQYIVEFGNWLRVGEEEFNTLYDAYNYANENDTIYVIRDAYVNFAQSLGEEKKVTLDLNGHNVITTQPLVINGEKTIKDSGSLGTIHNLRDYAITNNGDLTILSGTYTSDTTYGINNAGKLTIQEGTIEGTSGIYNGSTLIVEGGKIQGKSSTGVYNVATATVNDGEILSNSTNAYTNAKGSTTITGGLIKSTSGNGYHQEPGYYDWGYLKITGGEIEGSSNGIYVGGYSSSCDIEGGGVVGKSGSGAYLTTGNDTVTGGILEGKQYGVYSSTNTTIGVNDRTISIDLPLIKGELYGLYIAGGTLNFYDGILKGITGAYSGQVTNIPERAEIFMSPETIDGIDYETKYLITESVIAINLNQFYEDGSNKEYTNLQDALDDGQEGDTIQLVANVPLYYSVNNTNTSPFTLDLNGFNITTNKAIINSGRLTVVNTSNSESVIRTSSSIVLLTNNNELNFDNVTLTNTSSSNYVLSISAGGKTTANNLKINAQNGIVNRNNLTVTNSEIKASGTGIENSGYLNVEATTFINGNYGIYTSTNREVNITGSTFNNSYYGKGNPTTIEESIFNANFEVNGGTTNVNNSHFNFGYLNRISNGGTTTITNSEVKGNGTISNSGTLAFNTTDIDTYYYQERYYTNDISGISNSGTLNMIKTTYKFDKNGSANVGTVRGINTSGSVNIDNKTEITIGSSDKHDNTVYGIYATSNKKSTINDSTIRVLGSNTGYGIYVTDSAHVQLETGEVYVLDTKYSNGAYINTGRFTLGHEEDEDNVQIEVSQDNPLVYAVGSTRGIGIKKVNGEFHFFDGKLWGSRYAKPETTTKVQRHYEVTTYVDPATGYEYAWLEYMPDNYQGETNVYLAGIYYTTLQGAINAYDSYAYTGEHIKLLKSITEDVIISAGQSAIIDLNGHSVTGQAVNYGTLQVYNGSLQNFEDPAVINGGTLKIGLDDGNVSSTNVRIVSEGIAIDNEGNVEFYDGYIEGNPTLETDFSKMAEFSRIYTVNEAQYERKYLQSLSEESIRNKETDLMITIDPNDGYYENSKDTKVIWLKYEETYQLSEPVKHACNFIGWEVNDDVLDENNLITMDVKDVYVTAKWEVSSEAVAKIGNEYYFTLEEALEAAKAKDIIELLTDINEDITNTKEVTIDMKGHIIEGVFVNEGILTLLDGIINNPNGTGLVNNKTLTVGVNDGEIETAKIQIIGTTLGLEQNGHFNFYDGYIEGDVAMIGTTDSVPRGYFLYTEHNDIKDCQRLYLIGNPANAVAIIQYDTTTQYFFNLRDAIEAARVSGKEIFIVRDFEAAYPVEIREDANIVINMSSYNITTGNLITNNGTLTIRDTSEEIGSIKTARAIVNNGTLNVDKVHIENNTNNVTIDNKGE